MCAMDRMPREGEGEEGVCMHERKLVVVMTHKYRGSTVVLSISKSVEPNEEQKEIISGFQQGILCKRKNYR